MHIEFTTDNAAFEEDPEDEIAEVLHNIGRAIRSGATQGVILDRNGNRIGAWAL